MQNIKDIKNSATIDSHAHIFEYSASEPSELFAWNCGVPHSLRSNTRCLFWMIHNTFILSAVYSSPKGYKRTITMKWIIIIGKTYGNTHSILFLVKNSIFNILVSRWLSNWLSMQEKWNVDLIIYTYFLILIWHVVLKSRIACYVLTLL